MSTANLIRKHIEDLTPEELFTTRDLLCYGLRSTVDNTLSSMVKAGKITRVARGVFARSERTKPVTVLEVATIKARSFGRQIITHAADIAGRLGLLKRPSSGHYFATDGKTSSFRFGSVIIHFKGTSRRKMFLGDNPPGQAIRTLCHLGKDSLSAHVIAVVAKSLKHSERADIVRLCAFMPSWLYRALYAWFKSSQRVVNETENNVYASSKQNTSPDSFSVCEPAGAGNRQIYSIMLRKYAYHSKVVIPGSFSAGAYADQGRRVAHRLTG